MNINWNCFQKNDKFKTFSHNDDIQQINKLLADYNIQVDSYIDSPTITTYKCNLSVNTKINQILRLENNFAIACKDNNVRVYLDGDQLCIEKKGADNTVFMGDMLSAQFMNREELLLAIGINNKGEKIFYDLNKAPHMLIAGTTGSGKSVFLHQLIVSLLINHSTDVDIIGIDPKGVEFREYNPIQTFTFVQSTREAIKTLENLTDEMDRRYMTLAEAHCRDITEYNSKGGEMRRIVCIIDEFADLIMSSCREVEDYTVRLAQKARACGIHLIIATQRPTVNVITGLIKANIPTRISFKVTNQIDSRVILDRKGAERLNGKGDMLFLANGSFEPMRCQGSYMETWEITNAAVRSYLLNGGDENNVIRGTRQNG